MLHKSKEDNPLCRMLQKWQTKQISNQNETSNLLHNSSRAIEAKKDYSELDYTVLVTAWRKTEGVKTIFLKDLTVTAGSKQEFLDKHTSQAHFLCPKWRWRKWRFQR